MLLRLVLCSLFCSTLASAATPRAKLTAPAAALLAKGKILVLPEDNLALALPPAGKPVPLIEPAPKKIVRVTGAPSLLAVDDDILALRGGVLARLAFQAGAMPAATADGALIAGIDEKRNIKLTQAGASKIVPYKRDGRYELEYPYVPPGGKYVLVALRDYTQPLDAFFFLIVDVATLAVQEINLSKNFVPGSLRHTISADEVALQMFAQHKDGDSVTLSESDFVVFDFRTRKLGTAPPGLRPGRLSPSGKRSLVEGRMIYSDDKSCGADETIVYDEGKKPAPRTAGPGTVVTLLDFLPDETAFIGAVLAPKGCKLRGVLVPIGADDPARWKTFALPTHAGRPTAFVLP